MINLKTVFFRSSSSLMKTDSAISGIQQQRRSNFHKCPVNTLLTSIFSGIAWNG